MKKIDIPNREEISRLMNRSWLEFDETLNIVKKIIKEVRENGDLALITLTRKLDKYPLSKDNIRVSEKEIDEAYSKVNAKFLAAVKKAKKNIEKFHKEQMKRIEKSFKVVVDDGIEIFEAMIPIERVGCYIPGGKSPYVSTVLMTTIPAKIAGVEEIALVSPPEIKPEILVAADICGVREIYRVGGSQAIAALAYGTETIKKVAKIVGPGNKYVALAKLLVFGDVGIDSLAGPSEVLIIADDSSNPRYVAFDLLAQAEHDPNASAILITPSDELASKVIEEIENNENKFSDQIAIIIANDLEECIEFANQYAPEHLEIQTKNPEEIAMKIKNAGTIFLGPYSPVVAGDYASGANHVLPTSGSARFFSELSVRDFLRNVSVQKIEKSGLEKLRETIKTLAAVEKMEMHLKSLEARFEKDEAL